MMRFKQRWDQVGLSLLSVIILLCTCQLFLSSEIPSGGDTATHIAEIARLAKIIQHNGMWWTPDYYGGFPIGLYYQPLPHTAAALLAIALGGPAQTILVYKILVILLLIAFPWAIYFGLRGLQIDRAASFFSALLALAIHSTGPSGFATDIFGKFASSTQAVLQTGLFTQAWGNVFFPLAMSMLYRSLQGEVATYKWSALLLSLLFSSHLFYGIALVLIAMVLPLLQSPWPYSRFSLLAVLIVTICLLINIAYLLPHFSEIGLLALLAVYLVLIPGLLHKYLRLLGIGLVVFLTLAFWLLPLYQTLDFMGGYPFETEAMFGGVGLQAIVYSWISGNLFDAGKSCQVLYLLITGGLDKAHDVYLRSAGLPFIAIFIVGGLCLNFSLIWQGKDKARLYLLVAFLFSLISLAGRNSFGPLVDLYWPHRSLPLYRYSAILDILGAMWAGIFLAQALAYLWHKRMTRPVAIFLLGYGACSLSMSLLFLKYQCQTNDSYLTNKGLATTYQEFVECTSYLRKLVGQERIMIPINSQPWNNILALETGRPCSGGLGVGGHDSLNFYYLEQALYRPQTWAQLSILYNFRYLLVMHDPPPNLPLKKIWESSHKTYRLYEFVRGAGQEYHYFSIVNLGKSMVGAPRGALVRADAWDWLLGNRPCLGIHPQLDFPKSTHGQSWIYNLPKPVPAQQYPMPILSTIAGQRVAESRAISHGWEYLVVQIQEASFTFFLPPDLHNVSLWNMVITDLKSQTKLCEIVSLNPANDTLTCPLVLPPGKFELLLEPRLPGTVLEETIDMDRGIYAATVKMELPGYAMLKMTYHPFWSVVVDDKAQPQPLFLYPAFVGIPLSAGTHHLVCHYHRPVYCYWFLAWCWLPLALLLAWEKCQKDCWTWVRPCD